MLGLEETWDRLVKANGMRWYGHVFRRDNDDALRGALDFKVVRRRVHVRPKMTGIRQVLEQVEEIGLKEEDAIHKPKWRHAVNRLSRIMR